MRFYSLLAGVLLVVAGFGSNSMLLAQSYSLREPLADTRTFQVTARVQGQGTLKTPTQEKKDLDLPLEVQASLMFYERRLPSAGRDDRAWRSFRLYDNARSNIKVKNQVTNLTLSSLVREVICEGQREGLLLYAPKMPMRRHDLDLITIPGDPLALLALLPSSDVELEETWKVPDWAAQMFVGIEAATSVEMSGKLMSVKDQIATIELTGKVAGATIGALTEVSITGTATFDIANQLLTSLKMVQIEKRSVSTVSPGMEVTANVSWQRKVSPSVTISENQIANIPFDLPEISKLLLFKSKHWNISLIHDRNWYVFQEIPEVAVLRMVDNGSLISQCNIAKIGSAAPGQHVAPEKFESDIKASLGESLSSIVDKDVVEVNSGNYIYRVVASGSANGLEMVWIYYLCAAEDGRQVSFVFAVEGNNIEILNSRDLSMVESIEFEPDGP